MHVTVAICTWNRAQLLHQTLDELRKLQIPSGVEWEVLVVNNNCTDDTDEVITRHTNCLPLRRLSEPRPGKSNALNSAIAAVSGEMILWTDDDVLVEPGWLAAYVEAFRRWPEVAFFGGPVRPWFEGAPPRWLQQVWPRVANAYANRDLGAEPILLSPQAQPFGANFAIRTEVQRKYLYDPDLGPKKNGTLRGEETEVILQMMADGLLGRWVPAAGVRHYIPQSRQTTQYLRGFFRGQGEYQARQPSGLDVPRLFGRPRWVCRKLVAAEFRYLLQRAFGKPESWIESLMEASIMWGYFGMGSPRPSVSGIPPLGKI